MHLRLLFPCVLATQLIAGNLGCAGSNRLKPKQPIKLDVCSNGERLIPRMGTNLYCEDGQWVPVPPLHKT